MFLVFVSWKMITLKLYSSLRIRLKKLIHSIKRLFCEQEGGEAFALNFPGAFHSLQEPRFWPIIQLIMYKEVHVC